jgi:hypothetical protein
LNVFNWILHFNAFPFLPNPHRGIDLSCGDFERESDGLPVVTVKGPLANETCTRTMENAIETQINVQEAKRTSDTRASQCHFGQSGKQRGP